MQNTDFRLCPLFARPSSLLIHMTCLRFIEELVIIVDDSNLINGLEEEDRP